MAHITDKFLASYIETALWSSTDDSGEPLYSSKYCDAELSSNTLAIFKDDCRRFEMELHKLLAPLDDLVIRSMPDHFAHDFWLTRNHHGAGFWDGDYPEPIATQLTNLAHSFGECNLYVGDDHLMHSAPIFE